MTKAKRCKVCKGQYTPTKPMQAVCSPGCALELAKAKREREEKRVKQEQRRVDRANHERLKTRRDWEREAQAAFNAYIRARDANKPCICCGLPLASGDVGGRFDAGHYRSVGSAPHLRYVETNCHGQRKQCNRYGAGRAVDYRLGLIARIGLASVEALEADQTPRKYSIAQLKEIRDTYRAKRREIIKGASHA